jgi:hypothetical protein
LATIHIPWRHILKRKFCTTIGMFWVPLKVQPKMKNWTFRHSTELLNWTIALFYWVCKMHDIVRGLVCRYKISRWDRCLIIIDPLICLILICINGTTLSKFFFSWFASCLAWSSMKSIIILKLCFQFMELGSRYSYPFSNTSRREVHEIMLRSTAISWPAGLYINGEHNLESVVPLMQIRIKQISGSMMIKHLSHLDILYLQTRPLTMSFVYVNQII